MKTTILSANGRHGSASLGRGLKLDTVCCERAGTEGKLAPVAVMVTRLKVS